MKFIANKVDHLLCLITNIKEEKWCRGTIRQASM